MWLGERVGSRDVETHVGWPHTALTPPDRNNKNIDTINMSMTAKAYTYPLRPRFSCEASSLTVRSFVSLFN